STKDPSRIRFSGGVVGDNLGQFYGALVSSITPSRTQKGVIWAGTNDGKVWITRDEGKNWMDLTANVKMPPWGLVRRIDASPFDPGTAYMAVDYHLVDQRDPYFFKTSDFGKTWTRIDVGLPKGHPLDYALSIAENPHRKGMLFAGTGHAFFYSKDDGATWTSFKDKLPAAPVNWIEVPKNASELVVATYGRGLWILRDLWQLERDQPDPAAELEILKPMPATRNAGGGTAQFRFTLKAASTTPITMDILGADGTVLTTSQMTGRAGLNEASWNLLLPSSNPVVLRSVPAENPYIWDAGRYTNRERPLSHWGLGGINWQPPAAPGKYTVRFTHNGRQYAQPFDVWRDVTLPGSDAELAASTKLQTDIVKAMNDTGDRINRIEIMRMQVEDLQKAHANDKTSISMLSELGQQMYTTELHYLSRTEMLSDDKWYVEKYHIYFNLVWLLSEVGGAGGDVMGGNGYGPTKAAVSVFEDRKKEIVTAKIEFDKLMAQVDAFNKANAGKLAPITDRIR
ncbi:MAG: hypothetical protein WCQ64_10995, partial [Acidobacteriota bacterium]